MAKTRVSIETATVEQLREFAGGLDIKLSTNPETKRETILERIRKEWDHDYIVVAGLEPPKVVAPEPEAPAAEVVAAPAVAAEPRAIRLSDGRLDTDSSGDPRITIQLHALSKDSGPQGGNRPVPVNVNGVQMVIERAKPQKIPYRFYLALCDAIRTEWESVQDETSGKEDIVARDVLSFPFNVVQAPPNAEVIAWFTKGGRRVPDHLLAA